MKHSAPAAASPTALKYADAPHQTLDMTVEEAVILGRELAALVDPKPDLVVGIANGAFLPAVTVAETLGIPCEMVKVRRQGSRIKQRLVKIKNFFRIPNALILWGPLKPLWTLFQKGTSKLEEDAQSFEFEVRGKQVLLVDDCIETGASLHYVAERLRSAGAHVRTAVYCWTLMPNADETKTRPDLYLHRQIQFYPWSNNSQNLNDFNGWMAAKGLKLWE